MRVFTNKQDRELRTLLRGGAIGILRTDTLYGLVAKADDERAVARIYAAKERGEHKSPIVLIASIDQLFDEPDRPTKRLLERVWPGPISVIVPTANAPSWIRRGNASVAYRLPDDEALRSLLAKTGPLIAPSANPEGKRPAMTIDQARAYFGDAVDFYVDEGRVEDQTPSELLRLNNSGEIERLR